MRKLVLALSFLAVLLVIVGADFRRDATSHDVTIPKKKCVGYTIIEYGKGIDCNGDTVRLIKRNGIQVLEAMK